MRLPPIMEADSTCMEKGDIMPDEKVFIETNISCMTVFRVITVVKVIEQYPQREGMSKYLCITDNGEQHEMSSLLDQDGKSLSRYTEFEPWYFNEWFRCLWKESLTSRKEYRFTEDGQEYWYQSNDFKKHFTRMEG